MKTIMTALLVTILGLSTGCVGPDPAIKAALDQRVTQLQPQATVYPSAQTTEPLPIKVGQWIQTKSVDPKGRVSVTTVKIVGQEDKAFWQEIVADTYDGRMIMLSLVDFGDLKHPNTKKMLRLKIKDQKGNVGEYPSGIVGWMQGLAPSVDLGADVPRSQEDVQVLAGRFTGCYKSPLSINSLMGTTTGTNWWHPTVPINGIVKSIIDNGLLAGTSELVAFGLEGAKSEF